MQDLTVTFMKNQNHFKHIIIYKNEQWDGGIWLCRENAYMMICLFELAINWGVGMGLTIS